MKQEKYVQELCIRNLEPEDSGYYTCDAGNQLTTASLAVQGSVHDSVCQMSWNSVTGVLCVFFHSTVKEVFIVSGLKTTDVFIGEWAVFSCRLSGRAPGKVQWWLDGTLLENGPNAEIGEGEGHIHTLTLKNLATDDSGTVTFKAGSLTSAAKLLVKGITFGSISVSSIFDCFNRIFISCLKPNKVVLSLQWRCCKFV